MQFAKILLNLFLMGFDPVTCEIVIPLSGHLVGCWFFKADCPLVGPEPIGGMSSVRVFRRDPSPYLREFPRKPRKTPNA